MSEFTTTTTPVTVTLNLKDLTGAIVGAEHTGPDGWDVEPAFSDLREQVVKAVAADIVKDIRAAVVAAAEEEIDAQVGAIVTETIRAGVYKTNTYGERRGEPTTLRDEIVRVAEGLLSKNVGGYSDRKTLLEETIRKEVTNAVANGKAEVLAAVRAKLLRKVRDEIRDEGEAWMN